MAPRLLLQRPQVRARGAVMGLCLWLAGAGAALSCTVAPHQATQMPESISIPWDGPGGSLAWYDGPTTRYPHGVLGDTIEATQLHAYSEGATTPCGAQSVTLPDALVFEDIAPRLADVDGDGRPEIIVVQSHQRLGAQLAIYEISSNAETLREIAATPFIGRSNRWLAPIAVADMDGDGAVELAYIDRPHLARTLRVWRYESTGLTQIAALEGLTNHRIGEDFVTGGLRDCGNGVELITADAAWTRVMASRLSADTLSAQPIAPFSQVNVQAALNCQL